MRRGDDLCQCHPKPDRRCKIHAGRSRCFFFVFVRRSQTSTRLITPAGEGPPASLSIAMKTRGAHEVPCSRCKITPAIFGFGTRIGMWFLVSTYIKTRDGSRPALHKTTSDLHVYAKRGGVEKHLAYKGSGWMSGWFCRSLVGAKHLSLSSLLSPPS